VKRRELSSECLAALSPKPKLSVSPGVVEAKVAHSIERNVCHPFRRFLYMVTRTVTLSAVLIRLFILALLD
jgi:hypothetical protein